MSENVGDAEDSASRFGGSRSWGATISGAVLLIASAVALIGSFQPWFTFASTFFPTPPHNALHQVLLSKDLYQLGPTHGTWILAVPQHSLMLEVSMVIIGIAWMLAMAAVRLRIWRLGRIGTHSWMSIPGPLAVVLGSLIIRQATWNVYATNFAPTRGPGELVTAIGGGIAFFAVIVDLWARPTSDSAPLSTGHGITQPVQL